MASVLGQTVQRARAGGRRRRLDRRHGRACSRRSTTRGSSSCATTERLGLARLAQPGARPRSRPLGGAARRGRRRPAAPTRASARAALRETPARHRRLGRCSSSTTVGRPGPIPPDAATAARGALARALQLAVLPPERRSSTASCSSGTSSATTPSFAESEDYDLWSRLLAHAEGANIGEPLVLYRVHARPGDEAAARRPARRSSARWRCGRSRRSAPELSPEDAELAWRLGSGEVRRPSRGAVDAFARAAARGLRESRHGARATPAVAAAGARALLARGRAAGARSALVPAPADGRRAAARARRGAALARAGARRRAPRRCVRSTRRRRSASASRYVSPEPTPFRSIMFDRIAQRPEVDFTRRLLRAHDLRPHVDDRAAGIAPTFIGRRRASRACGDVLRHDYPITTRDLRRARGLAAGRRRRRGLEHVRGAGGRALVPRGAASRTCCSSRATTPTRGRAGAARSSGSSCRRSCAAPSACSRSGRWRASPCSPAAPTPERVRWFANTIDVAGFVERAERLQSRRPELRAAIGAGDEDVVVLSVARLAPEKGLDTLVRAAATAADPRSARRRRRRRARARAARRSSRARARRAAAARRRRALRARRRALRRRRRVRAALDARAVGRRRQRGGRLRAAARPLRPGRRRTPTCSSPGENGMLVARRRRAAARRRALRRLAADPELRRRSGERSLELMRGWGYEPSIENFVAAVRAPRRRGRSLPAVGDALPGVARAASTRAPREPLAQRRRRRAPARRAATIASALVRHDERLALLERARDAAAVGDDDRASRPRPPRPRPCRSSRPPRRARTRRRRRRGPTAGRRSAAARGRVPRAPGSPLCRAAPRRRPWRSSGPAITTWASGAPPRGLDAGARSPCRRRSGRRRGRAARRRGCRAARAPAAPSRPGGASGKPLPRTTTRSGSSPKATTSSRSRAEAVTTASAPAATARPSDASKASFSRTLRSRGRNIPSGSSTYGIPRARHHSAVAVVSGSRKPKRCATSGRGSRAQLERQRRRDAHPAVRERRAEVVDAWLRPRRRHACGTAGRRCRSRSSS